MLPYVCSVTDHRWRQNVLKTKKWHTSRRQTDVFTTFWRPLWFITKQTQGNLESICFIQWSETKTTDTHTCLVLLDFSRICASLGIFKVPSATFRLCFFFILLVYSFFETFFNVFCCTKQNNGKNILQNSESPVAMTHDGNCREDFFVV